MAEHDAGQRLDLDVPHRRALVLGEVAHLRLRELDVVDVARRELGQAAADLGVGEAVVVAVPAVELDRQLAHGLVAAGLDVGEHRLDRGADLGVVLGDCARVAPALEPACHSSSSPPAPTLREASPS